MRDRHSKGEFEMNPDKYESEVIVTLQQKAAEEFLCSVTTATVEPLIKAKGV